jgi:hypothetical protein
MSSTLIAPPSAANRMNRISARSTGWGAQPRNMPQAIAWIGKTLTRARESTENRVERPLIARLDRRRRSVGHGYVLSAIPIGTTQQTVARGWVRLGMRLRRRRDRNLCHWRRRHRLRWRVRCNGFGPMQHTAPASTECKRSVRIGRGNGFRRRHYRRSNPLRTMNHVRLE